ncbi:hypothetical protein [Xanthomonas campestris]|uniref:hypothetical protein n=1 Tax=Xanthomonas campestris TaxID=339 RepID=UPI0032E4E00A
MSGLLENVKKARERSRAFLLRVLFYIQQPQSLTSNVESGQHVADQDQAMY